MELSHLNERGEVRMVYVGDKQPTKREAVAQALVLMKPETFALLKEGALKKGDAVAAARIAGIMAAKRTPTHQMAKKDVANCDKPRVAVSEH